MLLSLQSFVFLVLLSPSLFSRSALSLSLSDFDGNLQSCHNSPTHRTSGLLPEICDSLTSRRQLCSASHPPVQHSSRFVNSFRPHLCGIHIPFARGVRCSSSPLRRVTISIHRKTSNVAALLGFPSTTPEGHYSIGVLFELLSASMWPHAVQTIFRYRASAPVATTVPSSWSFLSSIHPHSETK